MMVYTVTVIISLNFWEVNKKGSSMKKVYERYFVIIVPFIVWVIGMLIYYIAGEESFIWKLWGTIDVALAVALGLMAFLAYKDFISSEDEIKLCFKINENKRDTGLRLLRKNFTRSEILGVLGMIQKDPKDRFNIKYMKNKKFLHDLNKLQKGTDKEFILLMTKEEFTKFDLDGFQDEEIL